MERGLRNVSLPSTVVSEVSLGNSICYFISYHSLRMFNSVESSSFWNWNASLPNWMEVSLGKSSHHSHLKQFTLKCNTRTITECLPIKLNGSQFRQIYSSFSLQTIHSQIQHESNYRMHDYQTEWKSIQANLLIILTSNNSLSNTTREHFSNAQSPNWMEVNLGKSTHHSHFKQFTLKCNTRTITECLPIKLNGSQFRQIYSSFSLQATHSQIQHESNYRMHYYQTEWKSIQANLFFILTSNNSLSNTTREQLQNACQSNWMEVNSGKSIHHSHFKQLTLKYNTRTTNECTITKLNGSQFRQIYSSFSSLNNHSSTSIHSHS